GARRPGDPVRPGSRAATVRQHWHRRRDAGAEDAPGGQGGGRVRVARLLRGHRRDLRRHQPDLRAEPAAPELRPPPRQPGRLAAHRGRAVVPRRDPRLGEARVGAVAPLLARLLLRTGVRPRPVRLRPPVKLASPPAVWVRYNRPAAGGPRMPFKLVVWDFDGTL